ncbi:uncharacterized protein MONBRDRAFT_37358 [Monosiga brevicollis MX1]|uniref:RRM domain-containing protein n=1 Tax=Monosiga brevicollis TaxID=81824 RepID=A9V171_MONBE|nr:uncharacterized protein MONBRDRAFT_37358 [Monosiga brevicollis MX1]EDQ88758.1 predicted protein [Monosiga brevicollis MX1]|eukprot:XP_001746371.1 hypothetical protein [Monosiga brevicollis MX1]
MAFASGNQTRNTNVRLPPEVNRILYVRNLPFSVTTEELFELFGKYGPIRQMRTGNKPETKGTAYVVYEDIFDAKNACENLSGFNVMGRYLTVVYHQVNKLYQKLDRKKEQEELEKLRKKVNAKERDQDQRA